MVQSNTLIAVAALTLAASTTNAVPIANMEERGLLGSVLKVGAKIGGKVLGGAASGGLFGRDAELEELAIREELEERGILGSVLKVGAKIGGKLLGGGGGGGLFGRDLEIIEELAARGESIELSEREAIELNERGLLGTALKVGAKVGGKVLGGILGGGGGGGLFGRDLELIEELSARDELVQLDARQVADLEERGILGSVLKVGAKIGGKLLGGGGGGGLFGRELEEELAAREELEERGLLGSVLKVGAKIGGKVLGGAASGGLFGRDLEIIEELAAREEPIELTEREAIELNERGLLGTALKVGAKVGGKVLGGILGGGGGGGLFGRDLELIEELSAREEPVGLDARQIDDLEARGILGSVLKVGAKIGGKLLGGGGGGGLFGREFAELEQLD